MKAVIYARYSSDNQTEASIEGQLRECMEFAEHAGIDVIGNYIDRALSAKTDNRPEFQRMIKDSYKHAFDCIIVWKLDRFARNRYDSAHYKTLLKKNGVKVISAKETIANGSEGILLESVLEGMAEYYSAELAEKVVRGMTENVLKGKNNGGQVTFGYEIDEEMYFHPNPTTAPIVKEIFTRYADGKTIKQITDYLNEKNILTIRGGKMTINIVQRMLSNRRYIGEYKFRDTIIEHGIPALIDDDLFERVQKRLAKNKKAPARHKAEDDYILTLKLFCGKCGAHMFGESGTGTSRTYRYYKCARAKKGKLCDKKAVRKEWMEEIAIQKALGVLENAELVNLLVDKLYALQGEENPRLPRLNEQMADIEKRIENMLSAIEQGIITDSTKDRLSQLEAKKKEIEITILQEKIKKPFLTKEQILFGIEKYKKLDLTTQEGKQRLIDGFINAIYVYDDRITFTYNYKDGTETITLSELESAKSSDIKCIGAPKNDPNIRVVLFFNLLNDVPLHKQRRQIIAHVLIEAIEGRLPVLFIVSLIQSAAIERQFHVQGGKKPVLARAEYGHPVPIEPFYIIGDPSILEGVEDAAEADGVIHLHDQLDRPLGIWFILLAEQHARIILKVSSDVVVIVFGVGIVGLDLVELALLAIDGGVPIQRFFILRAIQFEGRIIDLPPGVILAFKGVRLVFADGDTDRPKAVIKARDKGLPVYFHALRIVVFGQQKAPRKAHQRYRRSRRNGQKPASSHKIPLPVIDTLFGHARRAFFIRE